MAKLGLGRASYVAFLIMPLACAGPIGAHAPSAQDLGSNARPRAPVVKGEDVLKVFEPKPTRTDVRISYEFTEAVLRAAVLRTGPSERVAYSRPRALTGSRLIRRDRSRYRLEGNKLVFSFLNDETKEAIFKCTESLIALSTRVDIQSLPRNEQLAYWFNLHNMLVIATMTRHYPVYEPRALKFGPNDTPFHEVPMVKIKGVSLSLNDIRLGIVYRYWKDPRVMYGFFRGDLASPNIRAEAWKASTMSAALNDNAREFVNALRGVRHQRRGKLLVSPVYDEARDSFFPDWPDDLRAHLLEFAGKGTKTAIARGRGVAYSKYERRAADLIGGAPITPIAPTIALVMMPDGSFGELWGPGANAAAMTSLMAIMRKSVRYHLRQLQERVEIEDEPFTEIPDSEEIQ